MKAAEEAYQEALSIRRELAKANPEAYLPDVAGTLKTWSLLYRATQRMKAAEEAYQEALSIVGNSRRPTRRPTFRMSPGR